MNKFTKEERLLILEAYLDAYERGNEEEAFQLIRQLPMAPHLAMAYKNTFGAEALHKSGFDLSEANDTYGSNWLA